MVAAVGLPGAHDEWKKAVCGVWCASWGCHPNKSTCKQRSTNAVGNQARHTSHLCSFRESHKVGLEVSPEGHEPDGMDMGMGMDMWARVWAAHKTAGSTFRKMYKVEMH